MWNDPSKCRPTSPVAVLEVHGTADVEINPARGGNVTGGHAGYVYPSVATTLLDWQSFNACGARATGTSPGHVDSETPGPVNAELWNGCNCRRRALDDRRGYAPTDTDGRVTSRWSAF
jgi:poly(3-hydroxybutyrate) depolymerase